QPRRRDGIFRNLYAEGRKRVLDRRDNRTGRGYAARLADAFDPERVERGGMLSEYHLDLRHLGRTRQKIVGKGRGEGLRRFVVAHPLVERVADRVRSAADELPLAYHRMDDAAAIVDHDVAQDAHAAGLDVHLDLDGVASSAISERTRQEALHVFEPRLELARHGIAGHAGYRFGDLAQRKSAPGRAGDLDPAVAQRKIAHARLQQVSRDLARLVAHLDRGEVDG